MFDDGIDGDAFSNQIVDSLIGDCIFDYVFRDRIWDSSLFVAFDERFDDSFAAASIKITSTIFVLVSSLPVFV